MNKKLLYLPLFCILLYSCDLDSPTDAPNVLFFKDSVAVGTSDTGWIDLLIDSYIYILNDLRVKTISINFKLQTNVGNAYIVRIYRQTDSTELIGIFNYNYEIKDTQYNFTNLSVLAFKPLVFFFQVCMNRFYHNNFNYVYIRFKDIRVTKN